LEWLTKKQGEHNRKEYKMASKTKPATRRRGVSHTPARNAPKSKATRRPPNNSNMPMNKIERFSYEFNDMKTELENYAAHLRALDRKRLNGVGLKKQGFIERAYELAETNPEYLPHYLTIEKFQEDNEYFIAFRSLYDTVKQIQEILWNITIQASDIVYTDALEFYASVREAAKRRVDAAETLYKELEVFFKRKRTQDEEPTQKRTLQDAKAFISGKRDGKIVIENVRPKMSGGKHKVIDERFSDKKMVKETEEEDIE
jgi:hypothetical protein